MPEAEIRVGANVQSAEDAFRALGADAQKSLAGIGSEGEKVSARLSALDKLWDSPARLGKAAAVAKLDLDSLTESVTKAGKMTPEMAQKFDEAGKKIEAATGRARAFADVAGDMKTKGDLAAKGFEAAASGAGSFEGMLGKLKDTGSATQQKIADVGFAGVGLVGAFTAGYAAGEKLDQTLKALGIDLTKVGTSAIESWVNFEKANGAIEDFSSTITGKLASAISVATPALLGLGKAMDLVPQSAKSSLESWLGITRLLAPEAELAHTSATKLGAAIIATAEAAGKAGRDLKAMGFDVAGSVGKFGELQGAANKMVQVFDHELKKGQENYTRSVKEAAPEILKLRDAWLASGKTMDEAPPKFQKLVEAAEKYGKAADENVKKATLFRDSVEKVNPVLEGLAKKYADAEKSIVDYIKSGGNAEEADRRQRLAKEELTKGLQDFAKQNGLTEADMAKLIRATNDLIKAGKDAKDPVNQVKEVLKQMASEADDAAKKTQKAADAVKALKLASSHGGGGDSDPLKLVASHLQDVGKAASEAGVKVKTFADGTPKAMGNVEAATRVTGATFEVVGGQLTKVIKISGEAGASASEAAKAWTAAHQTEIAEIEAWNAAYTKKLQLIEKGRKEETKAAAEIQKSMERTREMLNGISEGYIAVEGSASLAMYEITKASEEALASLDKLTTRFKDLNKSARDYAADIVEAYTSGFVSLFNTLGQLQDTINQLNELLMKNAGNQFAAGIREIRDAYVDLKNKISFGEIKPVEKMKV